MGSGGPGFGFTYLEASEGFQDDTFTTLRTSQQCVEFFREYRRRYPLSPEQLAELRGKDVMCWCHKDAPWCHGDVLLELANA